MILSIFPPAHPWTAFLCVDKINVGKSSYYVCDPDHHEDKRSAGEYCSFERGGILNGHEPHSQLRLGQYSYSNPKNDC
jgi:hypothetical protein